MRFQRVVEEHINKLQILNHQIKAENLLDHVTAIRRLRADMMAANCRDLTLNPRYQPAFDFLLNDLYGSVELTDRILEIRHAGPAMSRILPDSMMRTLIKAIEFAVLSLEMDVLLARQAIAAHYSAEAVNEDVYRYIVKQILTKEQLQQQLDLLLMIGTEIETVVHKPFVATTLKLSRQPARLMGLGALQNFLEHGFHAFKSMRGSDQFFLIFKECEAEAIQALYS